MVISTRVSIQWPPEQPQELTSTLALTTPEDNYVDVRVFKSKYPYNEPQPNEEHFTEVFELCIAGKEVPLDNGRIKFDNSISSMALQESLQSGQPIKIDPDIGTFSDFGLDRKETGEMKNSNGVVSSYIEIWRSLDPLKHTPVDEIREQNGDEKIAVFALELVNGLGKLVRIGNWIQGIVQDENTIHVIRSWYDASKSQWSNLIEFGEYGGFPLEFNGETNDIVVKLIDNGKEWKWKCIEKS